MKVINEVYFGKTKELQEIEATLDKLRTKYRNKPYDPRINVDPILLSFNDQMADFFGLKVYSLQIEPGNIYNACTIPIGYAWDVHDQDEQMIANEKTLKYNKKAGYVVLTVIWQGFLTSDRFTTPEIMSLLLHEMGHNFSAALNGKINFMSKIRALIFLMDSLIRIFSGDIYNGINNMLAFSNSGKGLIIEIDRAIIKTYPGLYKLICLIRSAQGFIRDVIQNIFGIAKFFTGGIISLPYMLVNQLYKIFFMPIMYVDEKTADAFATSYGYSTDLQSALLKFYKYQGGVETEYLLSKIPVVGAIFGILALPRDIIVYSLDEHPEYIERSNSQIKYLKRELQKQKMDPKLKREIEFEVRELEKAQDKLIKSKKSITDPLLAKKLYWAWLMNMSDGDIKHHIFGRDYEDQMDTATNRAKNKPEYNNPVKDISIL